MLTLSIIKADTGGFVGYTAVHPAMVVEASRAIVRARRELIVDGQVATCGDDLSLIMTHTRGADAPVVGEALEWADDPVAGHRPVTIEGPVVKGILGESSSAGRRPLGHLTQSRAHDADIEATAPCVSMLFDEIAMALTEFASEADAGAPALWWEKVVLEAGDLPGLACAWLNELTGRAAGHRAAVVDVAVDRVDSPADGLGGAWRLQGRVGLRPFGRPGASSRHASPATAAELSLAEADGTWTLHAHLDCTRAGGAGEAGSPLSRSGPRSPLTAASSSGGRRAGNGVHGTGGDRGDSARRRPSRHPRRRRSRGARR